MADSRTPHLPQHLRGFALIESLIAIVVMALGILGIVGVQMRTLTDTSTTVRRAQAIRLIEDLGERMKVNPNALRNSNSFVSDFNATHSIGSCASGCDSSQLAAYDLAGWKQIVSSTLPQGQASIFIPQAESGLPAGTNRQLGVMIAWRENERHDADSGFKDNIDATKINDGGTFKNQGGSQAACPAGFVCHLQYISVPARCAPYAPGGGATTYYCPGA
ncbi:type IV pilus modification protein PilV [Comamonas granuli]|uniref:type IV pilus modification protein PilV n=1 Tax=Comamonas granuli TaxID=290309 RepID=UPI0005A87B7F|nr:type IV pilus modification protein PilV [Comamonas granuli]